MTAGARPNPIFDFSPGVPSPYLLALDFAVPLETKGKRGYRIRLLSAAFRNHMHWSEFIGGEVVISPPYAWQKRFNASQIEVSPRIDQEVPSQIVAGLTKHFADFRRAYSEDGLSLAEFDSFGPTRRTLRQFIAACSDLNAIVRDVLLPNPDTA